MDGHKVEDAEVLEALSNSGNYVKPGDPDDTSLPPEESNFTPSVSRLPPFTQLEFRPEDSIHFEKYGVSAAYMESENNKRWSSYNFPWGKGLEEFTGKLFGNFSLEPEQREVINATMSRRDVCAVMSAGEGSAVTYQLPALLCPGMTLVVVPHVSLLIDQLAVAHPELGKISTCLDEAMGLTEQQRILGVLVTEHCEFKLLYVTTDTITKSKLLLDHLETLYTRGSLARIVIEEAQSVSKRHNRPDYQGLAILKQKFPTVPLVALASTATDSVKEDVVGTLGIVNCVDFTQRFIRSNLRVPSEQSKRGGYEQTSPKCSLTTEKTNSYGPVPLNCNIVDKELCNDSNVGVESMDLGVVLPSWSIAADKIGRRQRRQTKLLEDLCLLNSIYGENILLNFNSGIDISIPLRVLLSQDLLKDEMTILKINWTETQVGIRIEPRDGVNDPLTFHEKLQSVAEQKHIKGSIKTLLNVVRKTFNFAEIPIMVGHIIYPKYDREYTEIKKLGKGSFGSVFECKVKIDGTSCAIKKIRFPESGKGVQTLINEVQTLGRAQHPNVVGYNQAWIEDYREPKNSDSDSDDSNSYGQREKVMYIHMELCQQSLKDTVAKQKRLQPHMIWSYFGQILEALRCIHGKGLIHRDLKMDNIFTYNVGTVKIGDFGLAVYKDVNSTTNLSPAGAYLYRAPEMKKGKPITNKVDMYALGFILFQLSCSQSSSAIDMLRKSATRGQLFKMYEVDETIKHLILELLQKDPSKRPSAADLLQRISSFR